MSSEMERKTIINTPTTLYMIILTSHKITLKLYMSILISITMFLFWILRLSQNLYVYVFNGSDEFMWGSAQSGLPNTSM